MAKQLTFSYNDKDYTLEFTRSTIRQMEANGFVASDYETKPLTVISDLFRGAFLAHHRAVKPGEIDEIYEHMANKSALLERLIEMYNEPISSLVNGNEGNAEWTPNW